MTKAKNLLYTTFNRIRSPINRVALWFKLDLPIRRKILGDPVSVYTFGYTWVKDFDEEFLHKLFVVRAVFRPRNLLRICLLGAGFSVLFYVNPLRAVAILAFILYVYNSGSEHINLPFGLKPLTLTPGLLALLVLLPATMVVDTVVSAPKHVTAIGGFGIVGFCFALKGMGFSPVSVAYTVFTKTFGLAAKPAIWALSGITSYFSIWNQVRKNQTTLNTLDTKANTIENNTEQLKAISNDIQETVEVNQQIAVNTNQLEHAHLDGHALIADRQSQVNAAVLVQNNEIIAQNQELSNQIDNVQNTLNQIVGVVNNLIEPSPSTSLNIIEIPITEDIENNTEERRNAVVVMSNALAQREYEQPAGNEIRDAQATIEPLTTSTANKENTNNPQDSLVNSFDNTMKRSAFTTLTSLGAVALGTGVSYLSGTYSEITPFAPIIHGLQAGGSILGLGVAREVIPIATTVKNTVIKVSEYLPNTQNITQLNMVNNLPENINPLDYKSKTLSLPPKASISLVQSLALSDNLPDFQKELQLDDIQLDMSLEGIARRKKQLFVALALTGTKDGNLKDCDVYHLFDPETLDKSYSFYNESVKEEVLIKQNFQDSAVANAIKEVEKLEKAAKALEIYGPGYLGTALYGDELISLAEESINTYNLKLKQ